jgi:hypothetical protein
MRSRLAYPGGFVPVSAVASTLDVDPVCAFCFGMVGWSGWLHVATSRVVCGECMGDPNAKDGKVGERMAEGGRAP